MEGGKKGGIMNYDDEFRESEKSVLGLQIRFFLASCNPLCSYSPSVFLLFCFFLSHGWICITTNFLHLLLHFFLLRLSHISSRIIRFYLFSKSVRKIFLYSLSLSPAHINLKFVPTKELLLPGKENTFYVMYRVARSVC